MYYPEFLEVSAVLFFANALQGAVGFGAGMFTVPLLVYLGYPLSDAVIITALSSTIQSLFSCYKLKNSIPWPDLPVPIIFRLFGLLFGVFVLKEISDYSPDVIKQIIGVFLLFILIVQSLIQTVPKKELHVAWAVIAFLISGLCLGTVGMGGPPAVLWVVAHRWQNEKIRAALFAIFIPTCLMQLVLMYGIFGPETMQVIIGTLVFTPVVLLGTTFGLFLGQKLDRLVLKKIIYTLLTLLAFKAVLEPYL